MIGLSSFVLGSPMTDALTRHFTAVAKLGYGMVEVSYQDPGLVHAAVVKSAAQAAGLELAVAGDFTGGRNISDDSPERRRAGLAYLTQCVEFAAAIGAQVVAGPMYSAVGLTRPLARDARRRQWDHAVAGLRLAAVRAAALGVTLGLEPLNRFESDLVNTVEQGLAMCRDVGAENVGLSLDTFHMNIEERSFAEAIAQAAGSIVSFQASENTRGAPGSGHIPWEGVFAALAGAGYTGPVVVEAFNTVNDPALASALSLWRPVFASVDQLQRDSIDFLRVSWEAQRSAARQGGPSVPNIPSDQP
jgi:D-psicose/D-tagatose/L-ribulose 3-epimerase